MIAECSINAVAERAIRDKIPLSVLFELTYRCNLRCSHCYMVDRGEKELSFNEVTHILDQLAAENCLFLTFTGGEALIRDDFLDIARYARSRGFALKLFSNGNLITKSMARELSRLQPVQVGISIYGADAATHDKCTGMPGSFRRSLRALRLLQEQGVFTMVKCVLRKETIAQVDGLKALARDVGSILQFDPVVTPRNDGNRTPLQYAPTEADLYQLLSTETVSPNGTNGITPPPESLICRAGTDICAISPGGEVNPCVAFPMSLGNLRQQTFAEVWHGAKAKELRKFRLSDLHQCVACPDLDYCTRCWGLAAVESGDHLGPSRLNCRIARIRHRISVERIESKLKGG